VPPIGNLYTTFATMSIATSPIKSHYAPITSLSFQKFTDYLSILQEHV